jgi:hypothetical protein
MKDVASSSIVDRAILAPAEHPAADNVAPHQRPRARPPDRPSLQLA